MIDDNEFKLNLKDDDWELKPQIKGKGKDKKVYFPEPYHLRDPYRPTLAELLQMAKKEFPRVPLEELEVGALDKAVFMRRRQSD